MNTANTSIKTPCNLVKNIRTERLEKNIESIITGSLPYYKSNFKQILLANPNNAGYIVQVFIGRTK